jgi:hypothetical protein
MSLWSKRKARNNKKGRSGKLVGQPKREWRKGEPMIVVKKMGRP